MKVFLVIVFVIILLTGFIISFISCSNDLWYSRTVDNDSNLTVTIEGLPGPIQIPWILQDGQSAHYSNGIWSLYEDGVLLDQQ